MMMLMPFPNGAGGMIFLPIFLPKGMTVAAFAASYGVGMIGAVAGISAYELFVRRTPAGRKFERQLLDIPQIWREAKEEVQNEPKPLTMKEIWKSAGEEVKSREKVYQPSMLSIWEETGYEIERALEQ